MNEILDEIEGEVRLTDTEIFLEIWTQPRRVFKYLHENFYDKHVVLLLVLGGIVSSLDSSVSRNLGDTLELWQIFSLTILVGGFFGWISSYIYAALLSLTGIWLKGTQNTNSILRVVSYSMIPSIVGVIFFLFQVMIFGKELFKTEMVINIDDDFSNEYILYGLTILQLIFSIWSLVLMVIGISEIQKFSIVKSILNSILPILLIVVPIFGVFVLLDMF